MTHRPPLDELNSRVLTYDTNTIAMIWKPEDINIVSCIAPYCLHLFGSLKPSCLVWLSLHSFSVYSHRLKSALKGLLILFWKPLSFVQILIQTSRCLLRKFNLPVKFIWFRYTHNMRRRESREALWRSPCYICALQLWETGRSRWRGGKVARNWWIQVARWQAWVLLLEIPYCQAAVSSHIVAP